MIHPSWTDPAYWDWKSLVQRAQRIADQRKANA